MVRLKILTVFLLFPVMHCYTQMIFKDTSCGLSLTIPKQWTIEKAKSSAVCVFYMKYPAWDTIVSNTTHHTRKYPISVEMVNGSIEKNGNIYACFHEDSTWWIGGMRGAREKAKYIRNSFWDAVIGKSEVSIDNKNSVVRSGTGFALVALLDNRNGRLINLFSDYRFTDEATFEQIVNSIRF